MFRSVWVAMRPIITKAVEAAQEVLLHQPTSPMRFALPPLASTFRFPDSFLNQMYANNEKTVPLAIHDGDESLVIAVHGYNLIEMIGQGGDGWILRAISPSGQECALKVFHTHPEAGERELRMSQSLSFRAPIVHIRAKVETFDGRLALEMDLLKGGNLLHFLDRIKRYDEQELDLSELARFRMTIALRVAKAIAAIHEVGFVHQDVKPENLLFDNEFPNCADGRPHLTLKDLRASRLLLSDPSHAEPHQSSHKEVHIFTPQYAAPEMRSFKKKDRQGNYFNGAIGVVYEDKKGRVMSRARLKEQADIATSQRVYLPVPEKYEKVVRNLCNHDDTSDLVWPRPNYRSDVYSLGLTLWKILGGEVSYGLDPFKRRIPPLSKMVEYCNRNKIPRRVAFIIDKCVRLTPSYRWASANIVHEELTEVFKHMQKSVSAGKGVARAVQPLRTSGEYPLRRTSSPYRPGKE